MPQRDTSAKARARAMLRAENLRRRVLEFIEGRGREGATDFEVQEALGMAGDTERPRRQELEKAGFVFASSERRTKPGGKRESIVWKSRQWRHLEPVDEVETEQPTQGRLF